MSKETTDLPIPIRDQINPRHPPITMGQIGPSSPFSSLDAFEGAQRMARALISSDLVPETYRGADKLGNALIALEMAQRIGANVLSVMQSLYVVHGTPSWSSQFLIAAANTSGRFATPIRYRFDGEPGTPERTCVAWALDFTRERLEGSPVSIQMAMDEGWYRRKGSKWATMPDQMLMYRAAAFFVRSYAPELAMGMLTGEEVQDLGQGRFVDEEPVELRQLGDLPDLTQLNREIAQEDVQNRAQATNAKQPCPHANRTLEGGVEACGDCGEILEITITAQEVISRLDRAKTVDGLTEAEDLARELEPEKMHEVDARRLEAALKAARRRVGVPE